MKKRIDKDDVIQLLNDIIAEMVNNRELLTELDSAIGDGDLGINVVKGFKEVKKYLSSNATSISRVLIESGIIFTKSTGSTIGALLGTALIRAGKSVKGKTEIDAHDILEMMTAAEVGIIERGKAKAGDKTILDALIPAREAFSKAIELKKDLFESFKDATFAAETGVISTIDMVAKVGRARWLGERSIGHKDPGAFTFFLILQIAEKSLKKL